MINFDYVKTESIKEHNQNWPQIPDNKYIIQIDHQFQIINTEY